MIKIEKFTRKDQTIKADETKKPVSKKIKTR
jgi:hypothetical protein